MAGVTRKEFDLLVQRVTALETKAGIAPPVVETPTGPTGPTGASGPAVEPAPILTLPAPTVRVEGVKYSIEATAVANQAATLTYLQIAVRGPNAWDLGHKPGTVVKSRSRIPMSGSVIRGEAGEYEAYLAYSVDGTTWVDGPKTKFAITQEAFDQYMAEREANQGKRRIPLVGKSGLSFNSIVFRQQPEAAEQFAKQRGVPVDGLLWFTTRQSWADYKQYWGSKAAYLESGKLVVTTLPHAPESEGDAMNRNGAGNAYVNQQRDFGKWLKDNGLNHPLHTLRVDWECNGNWYKWSANRPGGAQALKMAITNFVTNVRAGGATDVKFDLCFNKGPSQAGADFAVFPGAEYIDVIGIDQYDMWSPSFTKEQWNVEIRKSPALQNVVNFAREHGIMWSLDEGGNTHGDKNQGGDNPKYWEFMREFFEANAETAAWHTTYDHPGAPASLAHDFAQNPKSFSTYKQLWTPR